MAAATLEIMMTDGLTRAVATAVGNRGTVAEETDRTGVTMEAGVVDTAIATEDIRTEVLGVVDTVGQEGEGEEAQTHGAE